MNEFIEKTNYKEKKVTSAEIIVTGTKDKPYFELKYKEVGKNDYTIGYSSYDLNNVFDWKEDCFEIVNELAEEYKPSMTNSGCVDCDECEHRSEDCLCDISNNEDECPLVRNNGWIPCSERLPEDGREVLAYCDNGQCSSISVVTFRKGKTKEELQAMECPCICSADQWGNNLKPYAWFDNGPMQWFGQDVLAWQPLPEPYNSKGE